SGYAHEKSPLGSPPQNVTNKDQAAEHHHERIILGVSGLDQPQRPAQRLDKPSDKLHDAVNDPAIPPAGTERAFDRGPCGTVHDAVNDFSIELPQRNTGILGAVYEERVVEFVDAVLVEKNRIEPAVHFLLALFFPASLAIFRI